MDTLRWFKLFLNHFQLVAKDESKTTFPSFSIAPKMRTSEIIPAIFFFGKVTNSYYLACLLGFVRHKNV